MIDILVFTCTQYAKLIPIWLRFFERTWPASLPYQLTYVVAGTSRISVPVSYNKVATRFVTMKDHGMAGNMLAYLSDKQEPFLMFMDDHMLFEANAELIELALKYISLNSVGCVRLVPWPGPTIEIKTVLQDEAPYAFGEIDKTLEYGLSLQASFWRPQTFRDLLDSKWNPWEIELKGSQRAAKYDKKFIGCKTCAVNYKDYMLRGNPRPEHAAWVDANL